MAYDYFSKSKEADAVLKRIPKVLKKRPGNFEEFQDFNFFWVEEGEKHLDRTVVIGFGLHEGKLSKPHKLAIWNAKRIKRKKLTENELYRIYQIFNSSLTGRDNRQFTDLNGSRFAPSRWKDSDNPKPKPPAEKKKQSDSTQREISL